MRAGLPGACLALALAVAAAGCGYSTGFTLEGSPTVGVEIFDNDSPQRDIEAELHGYVTAAVERLLSARLVAPEHADLLVRGRVIDFSRRTGIRSTENELFETGVHVAVQARLVRRPDPAESGMSDHMEFRETSAGDDGAVQVGAGPAKPREIVLRQTTVGDDRGYLLRDPRGETDARARVLRNLADRLVLDLFGDLVYEASLTERAGD